MKKSLDLSFNGKLESRVNSLFNTISYNKRSDFNEFVSNISINHINSLDWWVQGPASRNTYASPLFHYYCCLHLLRHLIDKGRFEFEDITIDSVIMRDIIKTLLTDSNIEGCSVSSGLKIQQRIKIKVKKKLLIYVLFIRKLYQFFVARITNINNRQSIPSRPLVLIDTFVMPDYIEDDRWYGTLWTNLTKKQQEETYFVPTFVLTPIVRMHSTYAKVRSNIRNYILKEDYLKFSDLLYAFGHKKRILQLDIGPVNVMGYEFSGLVKEELDNNSDLLTVIESILIYRFIKRLKLASINIKLSIDWFEGQVIDKAWNMGFKSFFPGVKTLGYRATEGFTFYLCSYPIPIEKKAGVIPDIIAVQGKGMLNTVNEFMPGLDTIVIPSFKSSYVWDFKRKEAKNNQKIILISLPISIKSSKIIIEKLVKAFNSNLFNNSKITFLFKSHPAQELKKLKSDLVDFSNYISFTKEKSFVKLLESTSLLITEASSTCLEAMACGVPVIMMENQEGLIFDSIPSTISEKIYRKVRTKNQLIQAIKYFIFLDINDVNQLELEGKKVRKNYFEPITKNGINRFFKSDI